MIQKDENEYKNYLTFNQ